jgi:hypothetical protein
VFVCVRSRVQCEEGLEKSSVKMFSFGSSFNAKSELVPHLFAFFAPKARLPACSSQWFISDTLERISMKCLSSLYKNLFG